MSPFRVLGGVGSAAAAAGCAGAGRSWAASRPAAPSPAPIPATFPPVLRKSLRVVPMVSSSPVSPLLPAYSRRVGRGQKLREIDGAGAPSGRQAEAEPPRDLGERELT